MASTKAGLALNLWMHRVEIFYCGLCGHRVVMDRERKGWTVYCSNSECTGATEPDIIRTKEKALHRFIKDVGAILPPEKINLQAQDEMEQGVRLVKNS